MEWLLKIVEGPVKGAEIALVEGFRLKVGSGDSCDIVLADSSLAEVAFELSVTAEAVTLICGDETQVLEPYTVREIGTTGIAVGPAEGTWRELVHPAPPTTERTETDEIAEKAVAEEAEQDKGDPGGLEGWKFGSSGVWKFGSLGVWMAVSVLVLLLITAAVLVWRLRPHYFEQARTWIVGLGAPHAQETDATADRKLSLSEIAAAHNLRLDASPSPTLHGNLKRRTERLAIRSLALAADSRVRFDLTDDETLKAAAEELLFVVTEGAIKVVAASNRVVTLAGYAPSGASLEQTVRALNADVKGIEKLVTEGVCIGGLPPAKSEESTKPVPPAIRPKDARMSALKDCPIAGILTVPYRSVVLRNGVRLSEGAQLGNAVIESIEHDRLVLRAGETTFEWRP